MARLWQGSWCAHAHFAIPLQRPAWALIAQGAAKALQRGFGRVCPNHMLVLRQRLA